MSAIGVPMVLAPVFGPTFGGFLLQSVSWHAIFWINVPIGIVTALVALRLLPRDRPNKDSAGPLDWPGLLLARLRDGRASPMGCRRARPPGASPLVGGHRPVVLGARAGRGVRRAQPGVSAVPLLDLRLYAIRAYSAASVVMFCMGAALFGAMILLAALLPGGAGRGRHHHRAAADPPGDRRLDRYEPLGPGDPPLRRRPDLAVRGPHHGVRHVPFLFVGATTPYALIGDGHGGPGRGRRPGVHAGHDRGVLPPQPRSGQRRQPAAQRASSGWVARWGRRSSPSSCRPSSLTCPEPTPARCHGHRHRRVLRRDLPVGDPDVDPRPHPRHRPVAGRAAAAGDRPRDRRPLTRRWSRRSYDDRRADRDAPVNDPRRAARWRWASCSGQSGACAVASNSSLATSPIRSCGR